MADPRDPRSSGNPQPEGGDPPAEAPRVVATLLCPRCGGWLGPGGYTYKRLGESQSGHWICVGCSNPLYPALPIGDRPAEAPVGHYRARLESLVQLYSNEGWGDLFAAEGVMACQLRRPPPPPPSLPGDPEKEDSLARGFIAALGGI